MAGAFGCSTGAPERLGTLVLHSALLHGDEGRLTRPPAHNDVTRRFQHISSSLLRRMGHSDTLKCDLGVYTRLATAHRGFQVSIQDPTVVARSVL